MLVHGFTQSGSSWDAVASDLRERDGGALDVVTPDLPGHGGATGLDGVADIASAAVALGRSCGPGCYVGYSMGGRVALQLALDEPSVVERLVLVSATAGIEDVDERETRRADDEQLADRIEAAGDAGLPAFLDEWLSGPLFAHLSDAEADRESRLVNSAAGLAAALRALGTGSQLPTWERLRTVSAKTLVVAGERDPKFVALAERMRQAIGSHAELVLVPGAGHAVPFERPGPFAAMVGAFATGKLGGKGGPPGS
jgi:2-succinyl-6-hydroxy-2,4-cyclohexadiene-1-carboxylate synthase